MYRTKRLIKKQAQHFTGCPCGCETGDGKTQLNSLQVLEICIKAYNQERSPERFDMLVRSIVLNIMDNTFFLTPVKAVGAPKDRRILTPADKVEGVSIYSIHNSKNEEAYSAFTNNNETKGMPYDTYMVWPLFGLMQLVLENPVITGLVINPCGESFFMPKEFIHDLLESMKQKE